MFDNKTVTMAFLAKCFDTEIDAAIDELGTDILAIVCFVDRDAEASESPSVRNIADRIYLSIESYALARGYNILDEDHEIADMSMLVCGALFYLTVDMIEHLLNVTTDGLDGLRSAAVSKESILDAIGGGDRWAQVIGSVDTIREHTGLN